MAKNLKINHTQVGPWLEGRVVSADEFAKLGPDVDVERLLQLEAVTETDEAVTTTPAPLNPHNMPRVDSAGRVVDLRGQDRPTAAALIPRAVQTQRRAEVRTKAGLPDDHNAPSQDEDGHTLEGQAMDANDAADQADHEAELAANPQAEPVRRTVTRRPIQRTVRPVEPK